jgi:hypothetical protein
MTDLDVPAAEELLSEADAAGHDAGPPEVARDTPPPAELPLADQIARVTGLVLAVLVPIHLGTLLVRDPASVDSSFLIDRWSNPAWLLADWGLLAVGTVHALVSLWARLGRRTDEGRRVRCPSCDEEFALPARLSHITLVALWAGLATFAGVLFLAASWGMLRLL